MGNESGIGVLDAPLLATRIDTLLGPMLAVADDSALVLLEFFDRRDLERELDRLPATVPGRCGPIDAIERELQRYFAGDLLDFKTPLRTKGTPFQERVWQELQRIPLGETRSYGEIAQGLGQPTAYRAVARANGANQLALVIPCHRVINANGDIGGYGGRVPRKKWLLEHERALLRR